jgi:non-ribosomal peptide synthetase component F/thioesterase domain-containing protein/aryl carrier-like protein
MATIIKLPSAGRPPARPGDLRESVSSQFSFAFPLSPAQERVWRADRQNPGNPAYNCAFRWSLRGALDVSVLERAFNEIASRHEVLRATFTQMGVNPVQLIAPSVDLKVAISDLRSVPEADRGSQLDRICAEEATRSFDTSTGPLIRVSLVQLEERYNFLLLTLHLLIADGWSIRVIMGELQKLYSAFIEGVESPLPDLGIQYPDYIVWQQEHLDEGARADQLTYWKSKLVDYRRLEVPGDLPLPTELTRKSDIVSLELPRELTDELNGLSNRQGGTMFITVLAACKALLCRYTGETDIAVGSELAGRNRTELEGLVGLFINHVVFRTDVSGDPRFWEFAERVRDTTWEILANQDVAFEDVIKARKSDGDPCPEPFMHVNFNCYRAFGGNSNFVLGTPGIHVVPIPSISQGALHRLNFFMVERESGWRLSVEYDKDHYSQGFALQLLGNFRELLEEIAANPERRVSEFQLSGGLARGDSRTPFVSATTETGAGETPDEVYTLPASVVQERFWLLTKLDPFGPKFHMRATVRLTGALSQDLLERSFQRLIDRHEVLRTTFADEDDGLIQIIASKKMFSLPTVSLAEIPLVNREEKLQELLRAEARHPFDLVQGPLFRACLFRLGPDDHVLIITTHHIIADGWSQRIVQDELWTIYDALTRNGQPSLPTLAIQYADFAAWQNDWLRSQEATEHLHYWQGQLAGPLRIIDFPTDHPPALRITSNGGIESLSLPGDLIRALRQLGKSEGVTMFTLTLAGFAILISRCSNQGNMVIGSPVANRRPETETLIGPFAGPIPFRFDFSDNPTLHEVLKRVSRVSLEALDHSDLPFEALLKELRVQSLNGRTPFFQFYCLYQAAFLQPHVLPALTVTPMPTFSVGTPFELQLAMIERPDEVRVNLEYNADLFDAGSIQALLQYYLILLRAMVTTADSRISDLVAPPTGGSSRGPSDVAAEPSRRHVAARNTDEMKLTEIWKNILHVQKIGVHDNFFELGGHSLLAAELVSQVKRQFGVSIDLSQLMVAPTIEQLAEELNRFSQKAQSHIVVLREGGTKPPLFCIHGGGGHLLDYRDMIRALPDDQPVYGLRASDVNEAYAETVEELAEQYILEIQGVQERGPYQICGLSFGGLVAYEIARKLADQGQRIGFIALFDTGNWAYYRNLPAAKLVQFRRTYIIDRLQKYGRNLIHGRLDEFAADAHLFITSRFNNTVWKVTRLFCRLANRPVPKAVRSNIVIFSAVGRNYVPKPYAGRLLLFRAEGRSAEYGDDLTLGWSGIAKEGVVVHQVPGSHLSIMRKPYVDRLVGQLTQYLADAGK